MWMHTYKNHHGYWYCMPKIIFLFIKYFNDVSIEYFNIHCYLYSVFGESLTNVKIAVNEYEQSWDGTTDLKYEAL